MVDYSKTKIYKIQSHLGDKIYVGSTAKNYLSQRLQQHKNDYKRFKNGTYHNVTSFILFDEYGPENCEIILIETCPCISKDEKNKKESHYIRELPCVNKVIPDRTLKEYLQENKEKIKQKYEDYYIKNKEKLKQKYEDYYIKNKEKISEKKKIYYQLKKNKKLEEENTLKCYCCNEIIILTENPN
jgi:uncharacterized protein YbcC (UPF0753/DUF2309 family)